MQPARKLALKKETLVELSSADLGHVVGGRSGTCATDFLPCIYTVLRCQTGLTQPCTIDPTDFTVIC